ncbi:MerR family transcriptional regulator [Amaricoccus macauensis]|uniref:MerR family transcriptional regulator n=1 Tax=Amaricoccus macauensis TaxID=57001 RepID=UPI003C7A6FCE
MEQVDTPCDDAEPTDTAAETCFRIAEVARLAGVSASTLRLWEQQGLIDPARSPSGQRLYSTEDAILAKRIAWYRTERGLNPAAIRHALESEGDASDDTGFHCADDGQSDIGGRLRALRRAAGQTLDHVADALGVSPSVLSTLERTSQGASFRLLHELAEHFGTTVSRLSGQTGGSRDMVPAGEWENWPEPAPGVTVQQLAEGERSMDCHRFVLAPGATSDGAYRHDGEEFLHVLSGSIEVVLDRDVFHNLEPGDSLYFNSRRAHSWKNSHDGETVLLWINTPPSF